MESLLQGSTVVEDCVNIVLQNIIESENFIHFTYWYTITSKKNKKIFRLFFFFLYRINSFEWCVANFLKIFHPIYKDYKNYLLPKGLNIKKKKKKDKDFILSKFYLKKTKTKIENQISNSFLILKKVCLLTVSIKILLSQCLLLSFIRINKILPWIHNFIQSILYKMGLFFLKNKME